MLVQRHRREKFAPRIRFAIDGNSPAPKLRTGFLIRAGEPSVSNELVQTHDPSLRRIRSSCNDDRSTMVPTIRINFAFGQAETDAIQCLRGPSSLELLP